LNCINLLSRTRVKIECGIDKTLCSLTTDGNAKYITLSTVSVNFNSWNGCEVDLLDRAKCILKFSETNSVSQPDIVKATFSSISTGIVTNLKQLDLPFAIKLDGNGNNIAQQTITTFFGGISVVSINSNGLESLSPPEKTLTIRKDQTISVNGLIVPQHQGNAGIVVVGLYVPEEPKNPDGTRMKELDGTLVTLPQTASKDYCRSDLGDFYMNTASVDYADNYCNWIVDRFTGQIESTNGCNTPDNRRAALSYNVIDFWSVWKGDLNTLKPMYSNVSLDSNGVSKLLYKDTVNYTGQVCLYFGYRLTDQTLVFNGEPIIFRVSP
jgi:hypothetical protein